MRIIYTIFKCVRNNIWWCEIDVLNKHVLFEDVWFKDVLYKDVLFEDVWFKDMLYKDVMFDDNVI